MPSLKSYRNIITVAFRNRRYGIIVSLMVVSVCLLTQCMDEQAEQKPATNPVEDSIVYAANNFALFAGSNTCAGCHKDIYRKHLGTAHFQTSQPAIDKYIRGIFRPDSNSFRFPRNVEVKMEKRDSGYFQVAYVDGVEKRAERFDIVVGSGTKGQTSLHWKNNELTQLPITWFSEVHQWANSPGYRGSLAFNRPITSRCLECHTTYVQKISPEKKDPELFNRDQIVYGVDCEKCHGPAAKHVSFHQQNKADTAGQHIINPAKLTRQQNLDLCALCHGGRLNKTQPSFSYMAGQKLTDHFNIDTAGKRVADMDVHGNQYGLMAASACFQHSEMTCNSCHNPHENEKKKLQVFSQRCMNCHQAGHEKVCKLVATKGSVINKNCVDCHMPRQPSRSIALVLQGGTVPQSALMRTHYIKVYPEETEKVLAYITKQSNKKLK